MIKDIITKTVQYSRRYALCCLCVFSVIGCSSNHLGAHKRNPLDLQEQRFLRKVGQIQLESQRHMNRSSQRIQMLNEEAQWGLEQAPPLGLIDFQRMLHRAPQSTTLRIVGGRGGLVSLLFLTLYFSNVQGNIGVSVPCNMMQAYFPIIPSQDVNVDTCSSHPKANINKDDCIRYLNKVLENVQVNTQSTAFIRYNRISDGTKNAPKYKIFQNHNGRNETYVMEEYKRVCSQVGDKTICTISTDYISLLDILANIMSNSSLSQEDKIKKVENLVVKMLSGQGKEQADLRSWCGIPTLVKPAYCIAELADKLYTWTQQGKLTHESELKLETCQKSEKALKEERDTHKHKQETLWGSIISCEYQRNDLFFELRNKIQKCEQQARSLPSQGDGQNKSPVEIKQQEIETCEGRCLIDKFGSYIPKLNQCLKKKVDSGVKKYMDATNSSFYREKDEKVSWESDYPKYIPLRNNLALCSQSSKDDGMLMYACKQESMNLIGFVDSFLKRIRFGSSNFFQYGDKDYLQDCLEELKSQPEQETP